MTEELTASSRFLAACHFVVSVEGRTATLRGAVVSEEERELAELVVRVEPGISRVINALKVIGSDELPRPPQPKPLQPASALEREPKERLLED